MLSLPHLTQPTPITDLIPTGVYRNGTSIPIGKRTKFWKNNSTVSGSWSQCYLWSGWSTVSGRNARWITNGYPSAITQTMTAYVTNFTLPVDTNLTSVYITGVYAADDGVMSIFLNGFRLPSTNSLTAQITFTWQGPSRFKVPSHHALIACSTLACQPQALLPTREA